jgi:hypothetical protein
MIDRTHNISIPANIRYNRNLSASAKIFYGEIQYEILYNGFCRKPLSYFAELLFSTVGTVRVWLYELIDNGFVKIETKGKDKYFVIL